MKKSITPKYLTQEVAEMAVSAAFALTMDENSIFKSMLKRPHCHVVILVPSMEDAREIDYPDWPHYPTKAQVLHEQSVGEKLEWEFPFDEIARCKALQLWTGRNDDRTACIPHLLFPGDTPYWGGVNRRGLVVTCSGVQPWFDKMISGFIADAMVALAHDSFMSDKEVNEGANFLS